MNIKNFVLVACTLVFSTLGRAEPDVWGEEPSPEELETELLELDAQENSRPYSSLEEMLTPAWKLPFQVQIEIYKSPKGFGISKEFVLVWVENQLEHVFATSTGSNGNTPHGTFYPERMHKIYNSRTYNNSIMDWAVFFYKGFAIHSTTPNHYHELGRKASKGCVRLLRHNARALFKLMQEAGCSHSRAQSNRCRNIRITVLRRGTLLPSHLVEEVEDRLESEFEVISNLVSERRKGNRRLDRCSESDPDFAKYCRR